MSNIRTDYIRCDVTNSHYSQAADWVRAVEQRENLFVPYYQQPPRRRTDAEFTDLQNWLRENSVHWMNQAMRGQRQWVLDAGALLLLSQGKESPIWPKKAWHGVDTLLLNIGDFKADIWRLVRKSKFTDGGIKVPIGLTNRMRKCDRIAREYCIQLNKGSCDETDLLHRLTECWRLICEAEDIMVPNLPPMPLEIAVKYWCDHREKARGWVHGAERWANEHSEVV